MLNLSDLSEWTHSVPEAAELIALDLWYSGELSVYFNFSGPFSDEVDYEDGKGEFDDRVIAALQDPIKQIQGLICDAIEHGDLKAIRIQKEFLNNSIYPPQTFVSHTALCEWLEQRVPLGELFEDYEDDIGSIIHYINQESEILKKARREDRRIFRGMVRRRADEQSIIESWKAAQAEIVNLKEIIGYLQNGATPNDKSTDKTMTTRGRRTHQAIIAALCEKAGIDWSARGATQKIIDALELMGIPADGNTIRKILKEIPDSLEARQK